MGVFSFAFLLLHPMIIQAQLSKGYVPAVRPRDTSMFLIFKDVTFGPFFTGGFSRQNENLPETPTGVPWGSAQEFAYTIGGTIDFSINPWIGFDFSALYDSRDLYLENPGSSDNIDLSLGYIAFQPSVRILWLLIGLAFDLPMSGSATENVAAFQHRDANGNPDAPVAPYKNNVNVPTSDLQSLTEIRAAFSVPILEGDNAELHLIVSGSYPLSKTLSGTSPAFDTTGHFSGRAAPGQGPLPTVEAGISYQFDLLH
jgi:hypothetical protein